MTKKQANTTDLQPATQEQLSALMAHRLRQRATTERAVAVAPVAAIGAAVAVGSLGLQAVSTGVSVASMLKDSDSTERVSMFEFRNMTGLLDGSEPLGLMMRSYSTDECSVEQVFQTLLPGEVDVVGVKADKGAGARLTLSTTFFTPEGLGTKEETEFGFKFKKGEAWAPVIHGDQQPRQELAAWIFNVGESTVFLLLLGSEAQASVSTVELWNLPRAS